MAITDWHETDRPQEKLLKFDDIFAYGCFEGLAQADKP